MPETIHASKNYMSRDSYPNQPDPPGGPDALSHQRIRPSGGYRDLRSFQVTTIIYDTTVDFCARFLNPRSRTIDQMVQAARSGRQNIAEGSRASAASSQTELRLVNVARASLDELLLDYEDFLRQRGLPLWDKHHPDALSVRKIGWNQRRQRDQRDRSDQSDQSDRPDQSSPYAWWLTHDDPGVVANAMICLIHQANYLLDQQIRALELQFVVVGGYSEQLAVARLAHRQKADQSGRSDSSQPKAPVCSECGKPMVLRMARKGPRSGSRFWGCSGYPDCQSTRPV